MLGKFITPDTIVQAPFDPQSLNRYSYCRNNPINLIDPTGHSWKQWKGKVIGAIVGIVVLVVTYNPQLAMMAYSFVSTAIDAHTAGYSTGRAIGMAAASAAASYIGGCIGSYFGEALGGGAGTSGGMFWGSVFGGMGSGAAGGAAGAAVAGGDVGKAAYQGVAIGAAMGVVSYVLSGGGAQQQQQDQTQEEIDLAAKNGDFQQANDIGAESGPEGRMAAAEEISRSATRPKNAAESSKVLPEDAIGAGSDYYDVLGKKGVASALQVAEAVVTPSGPFEMIGRFVGGGLGGIIGFGIGLLSGEPGGPVILAWAGGRLGAYRGGNFGRRFDNPGAGNAY